MFWIRYVYISLVYALCIQNDKSESHWTVMTELRLRVGVIGAGVAGVVMAHILQRAHDVTLLERNAYVGGHTNTIVLSDGPDAGTPVDTGFIVLNPVTYPLFNRFLSQLEVNVRTSDMSFAFYNAATGFQYAGTGLFGLLAQPANALNPRYWKFLYEILRFGKEGLRALQSGEADTMTLGEFVKQKKFMQCTIDEYIIPMGAAIWSTAPAKMLGYPAKSILMFYKNHGLLDLRHAPTWQTVVGGSHAYIKAFLQKFTGRVITSAPVQSITRHENGATVRNDQGLDETFDKIVIAAHADEALGMLSDPSEHETRSLGAWTYEKNHTVLHTDTSVLAPRKSAWASWNYVREQSNASEPNATLTYDMNRLQGIQSSERYLVTLNRKAPIDPSRVIREIHYTHPCFTFDAFASQPRLAEKNGERHTYYCGSYHGWGFHEDAVRSSVAVANRFGMDL